ncbi:MAG: hypothetical protein WC100_22355 [Sterolibacterium sp.]
MTTIELKPFDALDVFEVDSGADNARNYPDKLRRIGIAMSLQPGVSNVIHDGSRRYDRRGDRDVAR